MDLDEMCWSKLLISKNMAFCTFVRWLGTAPQECGTIEAE
jgi:hypothetical protein